MQLDDENSLGFTSEKLEKLSFQKIILKNDDLAGNNWQKLKSPIPIIIVWKFPEKHLEKFCQKILE